MQLFHRNELDGIAATLRDLFSWHLEQDATANGAGNMQAHEQDFRHAKPFLDPVFECLNADGHWEEILKHPPRKIEVALLPMIDEDRKHFPNASQKALTLFVSLPKGCISRGGRRMLWGSRIPNRFHFDENENLLGFYILIGTHTPVADL